VLLNRLRPVLAPLLRKNGNGFRPGRGCPEHILCLRRLIEGCKVKGGGGVIVFIDFRKAFDGLRRECIPPLLAAYRVPPAMIRGIMALYTDTTAIILTSDRHTDPFHVSKGILQGDTLAPFLFVLAVDWMMRRACVDTGANRRMWNLCDSAPQFSQPSVFTCLTWISPMT